MVEGVEELEQPGLIERGWAWIERWWAAHFGSVTRREGWGYAVWLTFGVVVLVPELWAAISAETAPFPTISGTVAYLEYHHVWVALIVTAVIVISGYSALRYRPEETGVLPRRTTGGPVGGRPGDPLLPYRTPGGCRLTRSVAPVREIRAGVYFACVSVVIVIATAIAWKATDATDEYVVGQTLYGLIALFWVLIPAVIAWPRSWAVDIPFATLFDTVRSLERRLRILALVVAAGLVILLIHLVLYPWPSSIPDMKDLHEEYKQQGRPGLGVPEPAPPEPTAP